MYFSFSRESLLYVLQRNISMYAFLIAGLNNVGDCQSSQEIMDELTELRLTVKAHTEMHSHARPLSISTIMYVPKFCSLDLPANCPAEWIPPVGFNNRRALVEEVNEGIKRP